VHVADVAAAGLGGAGPIGEDRFQLVAIEVAEHLVDEMAAAHVSVAVDRERVDAGEAAFAEARVRLRAEAEERIDALELRDGIAVEGAEALGCVDPEVHAGGELAAQGFDLGLELFEAHDAGAHVDAAIEELADPAREAISVGPLRVIGRPDAELVGDRIFDPVERHREIRLNGSAAHVREVGEFDQRFAVPGTDQRFAPRGDEDADAVVDVRADPVEETSELAPVAVERFGWIFALGEGAIVAAVVAALERASIEEIDVHRGSHVFMRSRTRSEHSQGPMASERSTPRSVRISCRPRFSARPREVSSAS
jgi:hypothetical protein